MLLISRFSAVRVPVAAFSAEMAVVSWDLFVSAAVADSRVVMLVFTVMSLSQRRVAVVRVKRGVMARKVDDMVNFILRW